MKIHVKRWLLGLCSALIAIACADAGVIVQSGSGQCFNCTTGGSSGSWADVFVTNVTGVAPELATDGRKVGVRATNLSNLGQALTSGNGASLSIVTNGSFDGAENAVRLNPPTTLVSGEGQYAGIFNGLDLWGNGSKDIAQMNFRWLQYYGSTYYNQSGAAKLSGYKLGPTLTPGGGSPARTGVWENWDTAWTDWKYISITSNTVQVYAFPALGAPPLDALTQGEGIDSSPDTSKLYQMRGSANHAANPPIIGGEWVCYEFIVDARQDRGNANGRIQLLITTRDGVLNAKQLITDVNRDHGEHPGGANPWDYANRYIATLEYLGGYWGGKVGTGDANAYTMYSHMTFAANMTINQRIGCPTGFTSFFFGPRFFMPANDAIFDERIAA